MMHRAQCYILLALLSVSLFVFPVQAQEDQPLPPYLYYYSEILNGFVIERTDGTDSRILAQNVLPEHHNEILEPAWSSSGKWLAWRSAKDGGLAPSNYSGWIISTDGTQRLTMLDHPPDMFVNVSMLEWAPDDDMLFVVEITADQNRENPKLRYLLIDANTGAIAAAYDLAVDEYFHDDPTSYAWLPEKRGVVFYLRTYDGEGLTLRAVTLLSDGRVETSENAAWRTLSWSPNGWLAYFSPDKQSIIIENLVDHTSQFYPINGPPETYHIEWNAQHPVAFLYCRDDGKSTLWLLDLAAVEQILLRSDIDRLRMGSAPWSPDGSQSLMSFNGTSWLFNLEDQTFAVLENVPAGDPTWAENGRQILFRDDQNVYVYDVISQQSTYIQQIVAPDVPPSAFVVPSPNGLYLALTNTNTLMMVNLIQGTAGPITRHSAAAFAAQEVEQFDWHENGKWMIIAARVIFAEGGPVAFTVVNAEDPLRPSELTVSRGDAAGWVPEPAVAHLAEGSPTSAVQQPSLTLYFEDTVTGLAWHSSGDQIAVYEESGQITISKVNPWLSTSSRQARIQAPPDCSLLPLPCPVIWAGNAVAVDNENEFRLTSTSSADNDWLARVRDRNTVEIMDTHSGDIVETVEYVSSMEWVGNKLVMITLEHIALFDADTQDVHYLQTLDTSGYPQRIGSFSLSPDGRLLAGASHRSPTHIWYVESGELAAVLNWYGFAIDFSPNGRWLAAGNSNRVTIWDVAEATSKAWRE